MRFDSIESYALGQAKMRYFGRFYANRASKMGAESVARIDYNQVRFSRVDRTTPPLKS